MDPVGWLDRSLSPKDLEVLSFLLQGISYGRVEQIEVSFKKLLSCFKKLGIKENGDGIYSWLIENDPLSPSTTALFKGWKHRLNTSSDILQALSILKKQIYTKHNSIAEFFNVNSQQEFEQQIFKFCRLFENPSKKTVSKWKGTGPQWFASNPEQGGTSKRLMMWFRWMVREDLLDLGLWTRLLNDKMKIKNDWLYIPVDTHVFRFANEWSIVSQKSPNWSSVKNITAALKEIDPEDPVKFDFSICHAGKLAARKNLTTNNL